MSAPKVAPSSFSSKTLECLDSSSTLTCGTTVGPAVCVIDAIEAGGFRCSHSVASDPNACMESA